LGTFDSTFQDDGLFQYDDMASGDVIDGRNRRSRLLELNAEVLGKEFYAEFSYSREVHSEATVDRFASEYVGSIRRLLQLCHPTSGVAGRTPSDFPLADLNQAQLDIILTRHGIGHVEDV